MSWHRNQVRKRGIARAVERQRLHAHVEGDIHWLDRLTAEMRCVACGATIARYAWVQSGEVRAGGRIVAREGCWELVLTYYDEERDVHGARPETTKGIR